LPSSGAQDGNTWEQLFYTALAVRRNRAAV